MKLAGAAAVAVSRQTDNLGLTVVGRHRRPILFPCAQAAVSMSFQQKDGQIDIHGHKDDNNDNHNGGDDNHNKQNNATSGSTPQLHLASPIVSDRMGGCTDLLRS